MLLAEDQVLGDRVVEHQRALVAVLRNVGEPRVAAPADVERHQVQTTERNRTGGGTQAGDRLDQLRLAVALDAGDPEDLAGRDAELDVSDLLVAGFPAHREVAHLEQRRYRAELLRGGDARVLRVEREGDVTSDHGARD